MPYRALLRRALCILIAGGGLTACAKEPPGTEPIDTLPEPPQVSLGFARDTVVIRDTVGSFDPGGDSVAVTVQGAASIPVALGALRFYGQATSWLDVTLAGSTAPSLLTLRPTNRDVPSGLHTAVVPVTSSGARNSPRELIVQFNVAALPVPPAISGVTIAVAGNLGCNGDLGRRSADAVAAANPNWLFVLGDNVYPAGGVAATLDDYMRCYDPAWGRFRAITYAAVSEKDQDSTTGISAGADAYFGPERVGPSGTNYYSFNLGSWHVIVLNAVSGGPSRPVPYYLGSEQSRWLWEDLKANQGKRCTIALWHDPLWQSTSDPPKPDDPWPNHAYRNQPMRGLWMYLYEWNADVVVNSGQHIYERFAPMRYEGTYTNPDPAEFRADPARGLRQFTTGIAGNGPTSTPAVAVRHPLSEYRSGGNGVLKLTLGDGQYTWEFINTTWSRIEDRGIGTCH